MLSVIKNSIYGARDVFESSSFTGNRKIERLEDNRVRLGDKQKVGNAVWIREIETNLQVSNELLPYLK